jgi:hypothetical protein
MQKNKYLFYFLFCFSVVSFRLYAQSLNQALNVPGGALEFVSFSEPSLPPYPWTVLTDPSMTHDGVAAARSGATGYYYSASPYTYSYLETTLSGSGIISFWAKKTINCSLRICVDESYDRTVNASSGEWFFHSEKIDMAGDYALRFRFSNERSGSGHGQQAYYILLDEVSWHPADENGFVFMLNEGGDSYTLSACFPESTELSIPAEYKNRPVTAIGETAFESSYELEKIILPEGLLRIEDYAFRECVALRQVNLPSTLQHIGKGAFWGCENLESIKLPEGLLRIEDYTFSFCESLREASLPSTLEHIGEEAFWRCYKLESAELPDSLQSIDIAAFFETKSLKRISIPAALASLGDEAFYASGIEELTFSNAPNAALTSIPYGAFTHCENLHVVEIPASVTELASGAFAQCGLRTISFAERNAADIDLQSYCFAYNNFLVEIKLPEGITTLRESFMEADLASNFTTLRIPASVTVLERGAFNFHGQLTFFFMGTVPTVKGPLSSISYEPEIYENAKVIYQELYKEDWEAALQNSLFHDYPTEVLNGPPLASPAISADYDEFSFLGSKIANISLQQPQEGDKLKLKYSEDNGESFNEIYLSPGQSNGNFISTGAAEWDYTINKNILFHAQAMRPMDENLYSVCSGLAIKKLFCRNDIAAALDNDVLDFFPEDKQYFVVSDDKMVCGNSSLFVDFTENSDSYRTKTLLRTHVSGPGVLSFWLRLERENSYIEFDKPREYAPDKYELTNSIVSRAGAIDPDPIGEIFAQKDSFHGWNYGVRTWFRKIMEIPQGDHVICWEVNGYGGEPAAYLDQVELMFYEDGFLYVVNQDGKSVTIMGCEESDFDPWRDDDPLRIYIPENILGWPVTGIGRNAFKGLNLEELEIPNTVTRIGDAAFSSCRGLSEITIPASLNSLGEGIFAACTDLKNIIFTGARPAETEGELGGQAVIIFAEGQANWVDGGKYRGLTCITIDGERVKEPEFSREGEPQGIFDYFNQPFSLEMDSQDNLEIRYTLNGDIPINSNPGELYQAVLELDDAKDDIIVSARIFRDGKACSSLTQVVFHNAKKLNEILDCPEILFVMRNPEQWQIIEELNGQNEIQERYLQAGPYEKQNDLLAELEFYFYNSGQSDTFRFHWRLQSSYEYPAYYDGGLWYLAIGKEAAEKVETYWNDKLSENWNIDNFEVGDTGWVKATLSYDNYYANRPANAFLQLDKFSLGPLKATPKITLEPPEAAYIQYSANDNPFIYDWVTFLGTERFLVETHRPFNVVANEGYTVKEWQKYDPETEDFVYASKDPIKTIYIFEEDGKDPFINSYRVIFTEAVTVRVSSGEHGYFPMPWQGYAQADFEDAASVAKGTTLKFHLEPYDGWVFTHWSDGNTESDREILCEQNIDLVANYKKVIRVDPSAHITNAEWDPAISVEGDIGEIEPDENDEVTCTITLQYPENYRLLEWFFYPDGVKEYSIEDNSLTATLSWGEVENFTPLAKFAKQTQLQVLHAGGQDKRGRLEIRHNDSEGEEIVLDAHGRTWLDIGSNIWLKASPAIFSRFTHWNCKYGSLDYNTSKAEITLALADLPFYNFTAHFVAPGYLNLQISQNSSGSGAFTVNSQSYEANAEYDAGTQLRIQAIPEENSRFDKWLDDNNSAATRHVEINIGENIYTARFVKTGSIVLKAEIVDGGGSGGGVTKTHTPDLGEEITINAVPLSGYSFMHWKDNQNTNPNRNVIATEDIQVFTAVYQPIINISAVAVSGGGSFSGVGQKLLTDFPITVTAKPSVGYRFNRWLDDETMPAERVLTTADVVDGRISLRAQFIRVLNVTLRPQQGQAELGYIEITDDGGGVFAFDPVSGAYTAVVDYGTKISFKALPNVGNDFVRWGWNGSKNPEVSDLTIDSDRILIAIFAKLATVNCAVAEGQEDWGTTSMSYNGQAVQSGSNFHVGDWLHIAATAKENTRFLRWNDGSTQRTRNLQIADGETTYIAEFVRTSSITVNLGSDAPGEKPNSMLWRLPWTSWMSSSKAYVFDVEHDDGRECTLEFYGQYGWDLPLENNQSFTVLPQTETIINCDYRKITSGTLTGWINPANIDGKWKVKENPTLEYPGSEWLENGASIVLEQGEYEIEFLELLDQFGAVSWHRPENVLVAQSEVGKVLVQANQRTNFTGKYRKFVPDLELSFSPGEASEAAGPSASVATLRRLPRAVDGSLNLSESLTVHFTASESNALIYPASVTIPAGRERAQFMIGVIDNAIRENTEILDGSGQVLGRGRIVSLTGRVAMPASCNCDGTPSSGEEISAALAIYDDDGPALMVSVNPSTMQEPEAGISERLYADALTIRRNDRIAENLPELPIELSVLLNGEICESEIEFRQEGLKVDKVTIPAGELQLTLDIATLDDGVEDGNQLLSIFADTQDGPPDEPGEKYAPGSCWLVVSDQSFPDYVVTALETAAATLAGGETHELELTLQNQGRLPMHGSIPLALHLSSNNSLSEGTLLLETNYHGGLAVGESTVLRLAVPVNVAPGANWRFAAVVNPKGTLREISLLNNTAWSEKFTVDASYRAVAQLAETGKTTAQMEETLRIIGQTLQLNNDTPIPFAEADIYVIINGIRRVLPVTSAADGNFSVDFTPLPGEAGHVVLGACYPALGSSDPQDEFDILGMRFVKSLCNNVSSNSYLQWGVTVNEVNACSLQLTNRSPAALTNLHAEFIGLPDNCEVIWNDEESDLLLAELPGNTSQTIDFTVKGTAATTGRNYQHFILKITSDEGTELSIPAYLHVKPHYAQLLLSPSSLDVTMQLDGQSKRGVPRNLEITVSNDGAEESGLVSITLPNLSWLKLIGSNTLASIPPGGETSFLLTLTADANTPLNAPLSGVIAINAANAFAGVNLPFRATAVAEGKGKLTVDAIDDYTYYEAHAPHLQDALVVLRNPYTNAELARGVTLANGKLTLENLPVGPCKVIVSKERHADYVNTVEIQPERETTLVAFLDYQAISYSWEVVRVEIEDRYEVELTVVYETNVPMPVVETVMPKKMPFLHPGETHAFTVILTNKGLIRADDISFELPAVLNTPQCAIAFNYPQGKHSLLPHQSMTIPVMATGVAPTRSSDCLGHATAIWSWECGLDRKWHQVNSVFSIENTNCSSISTPSGWHMPNFTDVFYAPTAPPSQSPGTTATIRSPKVPQLPVGDPDCKPCTVGLLTNIGKCGIGFIPVFGCFFSLTDSAIDLYAAYESGKVSAWIDAGLGTALSGLGCFFTVPGAISCLKGIYDACDSAKELTTRAGENIHKPEWLEISQDKLKHVVDWVDLLMDYTQEIYGASCWENAETEAATAFFNAFFAMALADDIATELTTTEKNSLLPHLPGGIEAADLDNFVARWNRSVAYWKVCSTDFFPDYPAGEPAQDYLRLQRLYELAQQMRICEDAAHSLGYESLEDLYLKVVKDIEDNMKSSSSVCAQVSLKISQTVSLTREAFEGTLTLFNGHELQSMSNIGLELQITDVYGKDCTDLFDIEELTERRVKVTGIDGNGELAANTSGSATVRFIAENDAAAEHSKTYYFGGTLSYKNPFSDEMAVISLLPVPLEVFPGPRLQMHYFLQRDIYGDDPLTEMVEPSYPAELSVLVYNQGFGEAKNFRIDSGQPQISGNDKGLLIDFALWDYDLRESVLNGRPNTAPLGQVNMGNIMGGNYGAAQWWLTASLQGHFVGMQANYTHLTSNGNPDICLIDSVDIHELHRSGEDIEGNIAFLVNDIPDLLDTPDTLWIAKNYASGTAPLPVDVYDEINVSDKDFSAGSEEQKPSYSFTLTPQASAPAWFYVNIPEELLGNYEIVSIVRRNYLDEESEVPFRNCWLTDRSLPDGQDPIYETRLHLFDYFSENEPQFYTVTLERKIDTTLEILSFGGIDAYSISTLVPYVDVFFNERIRLASFTAEDISLRFNGQLLSQEALQNLSITTIAESDSNKFYQYRIAGLNELTMQDGFYVLSVQAAGILNQSGIPGQVGKQLMWLKSTAAYGGITIAKLEKSFVSGMRENEYRIDLEFFGAVLPQSVTANGLILSRDGEQVQLGDDILVYEGDFPWQYHFIGIDNYTQEDGIYVLRFNCESSGVLDQGGNGSSAQKEITWMIDTTPPADISNLRIEEDDGFSDNDGITWGREKTLLGTLPEGALKVELFYRMTGAGSSVLLTEKQYGANETAVALPISLPADGAITLTLRMTDAAGNFTENNLNIFIDAIPLSAQISDLPDVSPTVTRLLLSADLLDANKIREALSLTVNGSEDGVSLSALRITASPDNDREYLLGGLDECSAISGMHHLQLDLSKLKKRSSGLPGSGSVSADWKMLYPLTSAQKLALAQAVNSRWTAFDSYGDAYWGIDEEVYADAPEAEERRSLRSGLLGNGESSTLSLLVQGPGTLSFKWRVSSSLHDDLLSFAINGRTQKTVSGTDAEWQEIQMPINGIGEQLLSWTYARGHSAAAGENCAWVDLIEYRKYYDIKFTAANKIYDGTTAAERLGNLQEFGKIEGHMLGSTDVDGVYSFASAKQGLQKIVSATGIQLFGDDADLYQLRVFPAAADILPKEIVLGFAAEDKLYDGNKNAVIPLDSVSFGDQLLAGDVLTVRAISGLFAESKVGTWQLSVNPENFLLEGNEDANYQIGFAADVKATISKKAVTISYVADDKVYDGSKIATAHDFEFAGVLDGDALDITNYTAQFAESKAGSWPVSLDENYTLSGNDEGNYDIGFAEVTAEIGKKPVTITYTADDKVYDGNKTATVHDFIFTGLLGDEKLNVANVTADFAQSKVGSWPVTIAESYRVDGEGADNYSYGLTAPEATISSKAILLGFSAEDKVYDGNRNAVIPLNSVDFGNQLLADDVLTVRAISGLFAESKVGTWQLSVNPENFLLEGNEDANYQIGFAADVEATISKKAVTISYVADDKVYDGSKIATAHDFEFAGVLDGDALDITNYTAQFAESKAGSWPVSLDENYTLSGNEEGNYGISFAEVTAAISAKEVTIDYFAEDKEFDGNTQAVIQLKNFAGELLAVDRDEVFLKDISAAFEKAELGEWLVRVTAFTVEGNDDGNYDFRFAEGIKAEILRNRQLIPPGWSMMVLALNDLTPETKNTLQNLHKLRLAAKIMRIIPEVPNFGDAFWVFNPTDKAQILQGLRSFAAEDLPRQQEAASWIMLGPASGDYTVRERAREQVWFWNGKIFVLLAPGDILPVGNAAWFWFEN